MARPPKAIEAFSVSAICAISSDPPVLATLARDAVEIHFGKVADGRARLKVLRDGGRG
jgi:hypothetical protein